MSVTFPSTTPSLPGILVFVTVTFESKAHPAILQSIFPQTQSPFRTSFPWRNQEIPKDTQPQKLSYPMFYSGYFVLRPALAALTRVSALTSDIPFLSLGTIDVKIEVKVGTILAKIVTRLETGT